MYFANKNKQQCICRIGIWFLLLFAFSESNSQPVQPKASETVFIHTDKENYLAGEMLWFRPYLIKNVQDASVTLSRIIYTELLNNEGVAVLQSKTAFKDVGGSGSFYLPTDLASGVYTLIAHTTPLNDGSTRLFFKKRITVINTLSEPVKKAATQPEVLVQFFPEGARLIQDVTSKIGVQVLDPVSLKGVVAQGYIVENNRDTVARFVTQKFGLGQFTFTPQPSKKYKAILVAPGRSVTNTELSPAELSGYSIKVTENTNAYTVTIKSANVTPGILRFVAHTGSANQLVKSLQADATGSNSFDVEKSALKSGITYFTLFDQQMTPLCERLVFKPAAARQKDLGITMSKPAYTTRENAAFNITIAGTSDIVDASVSVFRETGGSEPESMETYLALTRHLSGTVENPAFYFNRDASDTDIDNLMLTHGWRQFKTSPPAPSRLPEWNGHIVTATVKDNWSKQGIGGVPCLLSVPAIPYGLYFGTSDSAGIVRFNVNGYYGPGDIFVTPVPVSVNIKPGYTVEVLSPFADSSAKSMLTQPALYLKEADSTMLLQRSVAMQAFHIYNKDLLNRFSLPVVKDSFPFFGRPEFQYQLDDYKRFSTMEEVLREYVTPINVVARGGKLHMTMYDEKYQMVYNDGILVLLDGVPLFDYDKIFSYNPYKVKKLEIVPRRYVFDNLTFSGVASFETYNSKFDGFELDPAAVAIDYEGLQIQREFYTPDYSQRKGNIRIPDYRTTLLWQPVRAIQPGRSHTVDCFTSDLPGKYRVVIHGLSANGTPYFGEKSFEVK